MRCDCDAASGVADNDVKACKTICLRIDRCCTALSWCRLAARAEKIVFFIQSTLPYSFRARRQCTDWPRFIVKCVNWLIKSSNCRTAFIQLVGEFIDQSRRPYSLRLINQSPKQPQHYYLLDSGTRVRGDTNCCVRVVEVCLHSILCSSSPLKLVQLRYLR